MITRNTKHSRAAKNTQYKSYEMSLKNVISGQGGGSAKSVKNYKGKIDVREQFDDNILIEHDV